VGRGCDDAAGTAEVEDVFDFGADLVLGCEGEGCLGADAAPEAEAVFIGAGCPVYINHFGLEGVKRVYADVD